jgi:hypothetical protein
LKLGLSEKPPEGGESTAELAERIRALRAGNEVEAAPERVVWKAAKAEWPVTARIRERRGEAQEVKPEPAEPPAVVIPMPEPVKPVADYRQAVARRRQGDGRQMNLF